MQHPLSRDVKKVALALCNGLAGSRSLEFNELIANESWDQLVNVTVDPNVYNDPESYFRDAASISFLKKYSALPTSIDKAQKAVDNFWKAERTCFRTNQRLLPFIHGTFSHADEALLPFIKVVKEKVCDLIGERPPLNPEGRFGPGATFSDRGGLTTIPDKMQSRPELTHDAWPFLIPWGSTLWAKAAASRGDSISFQRGNRFTTVPKDGKTDRGISIEPSLNVFYQLAYGKAMRETLKKRTAHRVDLAHSQSIHRQVAREASLTGRFATIDLSQASDTVSRAFVELCIPRRWYEVLDCLRSPITTISDGGRQKTVVLEKFSSMGNGYTFELETVLFMAVCCAAIQCSGGNPKPGINVYVFGDDIIVPTEYSNDVLAALSYFGFSVNKDKTFLSGPFRESCGGDYFLGRDVRPFFLKKEVNEPQHFISMANGIRRMADSGRRYSHRWHRCLHGWFTALDSIPQHIRRCRGPSELGDICIHDEFDSWETKTRGSTRYIRTYKPITYREVKYDVFDPDVQLAGALYGVQLTPRKGVIPRNGVTGHAVGWVAYS
ncbi:RNA-directed RNA polymerase [ssRNA phage Gephyllon.1_13]|uniref:RNA-directed RNA polymerase n=2 Tax=Fiersviridae TaxID=2842319 RepID=A0A8S5L0E5_9VIRU|nr:RNA-directed RNA polymerase [ssRNA phage Gephyllon.1_13]QDH90223.1 MAG: RNA-dependent RNA polymerase [Leviviridae sp.]DAD51398.1 TPA_asm: RNA-directed RNA polymerase [ssRNA phage Gephyllon.1_13]